MGTLVESLAVVLDSGGVPFSPDSCSHEYTFAGTTLTVDVATDAQGVVRTKTFVYTGSVLNSESMWVRT